MKQIIKIVCLLILFIIPLTPLVSLIVNPMRRPYTNVRNYVLRFTPIGMSMDDVITFIESREDWRIHNINYEWGFVLPRAHLDPGWPDAFEGNPTVIIGEQSISVRMGRYRAWYKLFIPTNVVILWGFDANGYLIDVFVWKTYEAF